MKTCNVSLYGTNKNVFLRVKVQPNRDEKTPR